MNVCYREENEFSPVAVDTGNVTNICIRPNVKRFLKNTGLQ